MQEQFYGLCTSSLPDSERGLSFGIINAIDTAVRTLSFFVAKRHSCIMNRGGNQVAALMESRRTQYWNQRPKNSNYSNNEVGETGAITAFITTPSCDSVFHAGHYDCHRAEIVLIYKLSNASAKRMMHFFVPSRTHLAQSDEFECKSRAW